MHDGIDGWMDGRRGCHYGFFAQWPTSEWVQVGGLFLHWLGWAGLGWRWALKYDTFVEGGEAQHSVIRFRSSFWVVRGFSSRYE